MSIVEEYQGYQIFTATAVASMRQMSGAYRVRGPDGAQIPGGPFKSKPEARAAIDVHRSSAQRVVQLPSERFTIGQLIRVARTLHQVYGRHPTTGQESIGVIPQDTVGQVVGISVPSGVLHVYLRHDASFADFVFEIPGDVVQPLDAPQ